MYKSPQALVPPFFLFHVTKILQGLLSRSNLRKIGFRGLFKTADLIHFDGHTEEKDPTAETMQIPDRYSDARFRDLLNPHTNRIKHDNKVTDHQETRTCRRKLKHYSAE
jgi:hypothetical protein